MMPPYDSGSLLITAHNCNQWNDIFTLHGNTQISSHHYEALPVFLAIRGQLSAYDLAAGLACYGELLHLPLDVDHHFCIDRYSTFTEQMNTEIAVSDAAINATCVRACRS